MKYISTRGQDVTDFKGAVLQGLARDGGLYVPASIPILDATLLTSFPLKSFIEIAHAVALPFVTGVIGETEMWEILTSALSFEVPIVSISPTKNALELFHGPTFAFKDFGARFMSATIEHFQRNEERTLTVLVATSGDTGGAVGHGFLGRKGIRVVILYPKGMVSSLQEKQLTTLGDNVTAVKVSGTFDDCQALVKAAFADSLITRSCRLTSANSINIARLIPQMFYYFFAVSRSSKNSIPLVSVPSGNFGNLTAGLVAKRMGLSIDKFIAATNVNDTVPRYLESGTFSSRNTVTTLANAMDVGNPSNFDRMAHLYLGSVESMRKDVIGFSASDDQIRDTIRRLYEVFGYVCDPHGAIAYHGIEKYVEHTNQLEAVFLHTAHPAKFEEVVRPLVGDGLKLPDALTAVMKAQGHAIELNNSLTELREILLTQ